MFVPTPDVMGADARLDLTFSDGSTGTLTFPAELQLAELGLQPDVTVTWRGRWLMPPVVHRPP
jgi:hypothetical protein